MNKDTKLTRYQLLKENPSVAHALPETACFTKESLSTFLEKYDQVILKRFTGSRGKGLMKITGVEKGFEVQNNHRKKIFDDLDCFIQYMKSEKKSENYLIQQGIDLACLNNRPFDLRVIVQRRGNEPWKVTGKYAKVARKGFFKTNLALGGEVLPAKKAIRRSELDEKPSKLLEKVDQLGLMTAKALEKGFKRQRIWGMDIGISKNGDVYLIEVNRAPGFKGFRRLKNRRMYDRIMQVSQYNRMRRQV
ncbi:YheC/YheD family protein [Melghirimyces algeriensis]|uniref:YheC/D like ATP-grasp n=1 Tax=Melghirimyces algeriensis TaxID=910412 RepID=A0A521EH57_9BACL|nr:YheC/YheD family protein [Melghirimyces algeriensis]SMO83192.1 YheC/D like ATP-grasp [Melghirimyces algeriensis]